MNLSRREFFQQTAGAAVAAAIPGVVAPIATRRPGCFYAPQELIDDALFAGDLEAYITAKLTQEMQIWLDREFAAYENRLLFGDGTVPKPMGTIYAESQRT